MSLKDEDSLSCDWKKKPVGRGGTKKKNSTTLYRYKGDFAWHGVKTEAYKPEGEGLVQDDTADIDRQSRGIGQIPCTIFRDCPRRLQQLRDPQA